jgi:hypothetical protein
MAFREAAECAEIMKRLDASVHGSDLRLDRQPLPTEALDKGLRVFRLGEAERHEVAVIAAQGIR